MLSGEKSYLPKYGEDEWGGFLVPLFFLLIFSGVGWGGGLHDVYFYFLILILFFLTNFDAVVVKKFCLITIGSLAYISHQHFSSKYFDNMRTNI